jgi:hypothetical protein
MRPDYAKEIARRALLTAGSDRDLLTIIATYCIRELGYFVTSAELLAWVDAQRAEIEEAA